jgi:hypothetical protein
MLLDTDVRVRHLLTVDHEEPPQSLTAIKYIGASGDQRALAVSLHQLVQHPVTILARLAERCCPVGSVAWPVSATDSTTPKAKRVGEFHTAVPNWSVGDTFTTGDGRRFRILKIAPIEDVDAAVFNGLWMVEPVEGLEQ